MAALPETSLFETVELSSLSPTDINPLLEEETKLWDERFAWDFRPSADLLRRFLQMQSLNGYALRAGRDLVGYSYHVCEDHKALIGDFYVRGGTGSSSAEMHLLGMLVQDLMLLPGIRRIESQLMLLDVPLQKALPFGRHVARHDRDFMELSSELASRLRAARSTLRFSVYPWAEKHSEEIAHLIAASYRGHVDSEINDQYRTIPGARKFLMNIVKFPGCGRFSPGGSMVAIDDTTGRICGVCLASLVSANSGHITQLCVLPAVRGAQVGYEVLRQSLTHLAHLGCRSVSLTVTRSNRAAITLYEGVGFQATSTFPALVWEGF